MTDTVFLTDYAWPDDSVEREIVESAGMRLINGPAAPLPASGIEAMVREHLPSAILTCWAPVSAEAIAASSRLKIVARLGVGLDNIAVQAATARGVRVTNVPDYCVEEVSDHAVGFALAWTRGLVFFDREVRAGRWAPADARLRRLGELTCGLIGFGRIARATARKLGAFGCRLLTHDPFLREPVAGVQAVELDELLMQSDIVIVHAPLTEGTRRLINRERIATMRRGSLLINVSRGGIVDTGAVIEALQSGQLSAAALDVLESEPLVPDELLRQPGAMLTPHVAFSSDASLLELRRRAAEEVVRVLRGEAPRNPCNLSAV
ncbi:C-terminal binding protein [Paraburkholderia rhynchosiae]|uniref:C-terminal binding protein n=1 Tax=Paraburkholderia rhynchosiae TaxID=487049 RepID=A0A2N7WM46_9BURK|nr:C-terminal binding protein [Paraburkholderia rhynchosiae]PMS30506.1 C-terminal binding protein [Paraburkholderia rhynchosiae]CAB3682531.1 Formate dehydrogenase, mitochondrial [Paraburkholderia rhynchosiae]